MNCFAAAFLPSARVKNKSAAKEREQYTGLYDNTGTQKETLSRVSQRQARDQKCLSSTLLNYVIKRVHSSVLPSSCGSSSFIHHRHQSDILTISIIRHQNRPITMRGPQRRLLLLLVVCIADSHSYEVSKTAWNRLSFVGCLPNRAARHWRQLDVSAALLIEVPTSSASLMEDTTSAIPNMDDRPHEQRAPRPRTARRLNHSFRYLYRHRRRRRRPTQSNEESCGSPAFDSS